MTENTGESDLPEPGVHLLVSNDILSKICNLHRKLDGECIGLIEFVVLHLIVNQ